MKRVIVGMSGGVDSSVSAYLLKKQGYEVIGVFMKNWDSALNNDTADPYINQEMCQAEVDFEDAKKVCDRLEIPIYRVDFTKEYWESVFENFLDEYKKGRTPNPDILCNKEIKFEAFLNYALKEYDADYIAMGHYAQIANNNGTYEMHRGQDRNKDQTYFLAQIKKSILEKVLFPIGDLEKSVVRKIALEQNLITANKKDSTGICFIGKRNFNDFLGNYIVSTPGDIIDIENNTKVGQHNGLMFHTIGQRKGLGKVGLNSTDDIPWYVVGKNIEHNQLMVSKGAENIWLKSNTVEISNINELSDINNIKTIKFRYRSQDVKCEIVNFDNGKLVLKYNDELAVTPGQQAVFYNGEVCIGGGVIDKVFYNNEIRASF